MPRGRKPQALPCGINVASTLAGEAEIPDMIEMTADLAGVIPKSRFRLLPEASTDVAMEQPQLVADTVVGFLGDPAL